MRRIPTQRWVAGEALELQVTADHGALVNSFGITPFKATPLELDKRVHGG